MILFVVICFLKLDDHSVSLSELLLQSANSLCLLRNCCLFTSNHLVQLVRTLSDWTLLIICGALQPIKLLNPLFSKFIDLTDWPTYSQILFVVRHFIFFVNLNRRKHRLMLRLSMFDLIVRMLTTKQVYQTSV